MTRKTHEHYRVYWGALRGWMRTGDQPPERRAPNARAHLTLIQRKSLRLNFHIEVFSKGKHPYFRKKDMVYQGTVLIPLPIIERISERIKKTNKRVQRLNDNRWIEKEYRRKPRAHP